MGERSSVFACLCYYPSRFCHPERSRGILRVPRRKILRLRYASLRMTRLWIAASRSLHRRRPGPPRDNGVQMKTAPNQMVGAASFRLLPVNLLGSGNLDDGLLFELPRHLFRKVTDSYEPLTFPFYWPHSLFFENWANTVHRNVEQARSLFQGYHCFLQGNSPFSKASYSCGLQPPLAAEFTTTKVR